MSAPRVLITAGPVYGLLDDNKLVGNRVRGIWATKFAEFLMKRGYPVTLLLADTQTKLVGTVVGERANMEVVEHRGYYDYAAKCEKLAVTHNVAIMAAAVVNWIPEKPVPGKMPTAGFKEGDIINVPFVLAPRVINRMRQWNPDLTLIGCKMLIGSQPDELVEAAYHVVLTAKCNVVLANDMGHGLKTKRLVFQDRTVIDFDDDFEGLFRALQGVIDDQHFATIRLESSTSDILADSRWSGDRRRFDEIVEKYRARFTHRQAGSDRVFGGLLVPTGAEGYLLSPREKGEMFSSADAAWLPATQNFDKHRVLVAKGLKATLNAPLLVRMWEKWRDHPQVVSVLHLHEQLPRVPTVPYAPPGTVRDNLRDLDHLPPSFNIEGHGFIACLDGNHEVVR
jgi:phosphopantothenate-cysteine ligase